MGLGSNLGDRERNLRGALERLALNAELLSCSSLYETEPWGYLEQPRFLNLVCCATTDLKPEPLLRLAESVERHLGRTPTFRYGPRTADIDILFYDEMVMDWPHLTIPHPRLAERAFVLVPLAEIAPALVHPVLGRTIGELAAAVEGKDGVRLWAGPPNVFYQKDD